MDHEDFSDSEINNQSMSISEDNKSIEINQNEDIEDTFEDILEDSDPNEMTFEDILEKSESKVNASYPNEVYADLMTLVIKYKFSNITGNAIIKFLISM